MTTKGKVFSILWIIVFALAVMLAMKTPQNACACPEPTATEVPPPVDTVAPPPEDTPVPVDTIVPPDNPTPPDPTVVSTKKSGGKADRGDTAPTSYVNGLPSTGGGMPQEQRLTWLGLAVLFVIVVIVIVISLRKSRKGD